MLVETSGASDVSRLDARAIKVMDLKCPGSGESARNLWSNLEHLTSRDEVKFVIADRADYDWARDVTLRAQACRARQRGADELRLRPLGAGAAGGMDPGRSIAGADATPDAQAYLGARRARRLKTKAVAKPDAKAAFSRIRRVRIGLMISAGLFALWWIVEFLTYAGRTSGFDAFDFLFVLIVGAIGWLLYEAWQARCPQCGNPFFINRSLPSGFHFSTQCPYCGAHLDELDEPRL